MSETEHPIIWHSPELKSRRLTVDFDRLRGYTSKLHWHSYIEISIVISGEGEQYLNGRHCLLRKGSVTVLRLTDYHIVKILDEITILKLSVRENVFSEQLLERLWRESGPINRSFGEDELESLVGLGRLIYAESRLESPDLQYCRGLLDCLFMKLLDKSESSPNRTPIERTALWLHSHFRESPSLSEAAEIAHYSRKHFGIIFKREVGITYLEYLTRLKVKYAKKLLLSTDLGIEYIGAEAGFNSPSTFRRVFLEQCGISPSNYRESNSHKCN